MTKDEFIIWLKSKEFQHITKNSWKHLINPEEFIWDYLLISADKVVFTYEETCLEINEDRTVEYDSYFDFVQAYENNTIK